MHTCKVSVRDLVEFILRSGDIVSSSTGIRDTDAMQEGTRIHKKLQKQMGSQYHAEVPLKYTSSVCYDNLSFAISVEGRADGIFPKALLPRLYDFADFSSEIPLETEAEHTHPIIPCRTIIHDDSEAPTDFIDEIKGIYVPFWLAYIVMYTQCTSPLPFTVLRRCVMRIFMPRRNTFHPLVSASLIVIFPRKISAIFMK